MRVMDGLMSIPPVLLAIALMALTKASIENVILAITLAEVPRVVRLVRSLVLTLARAALRRGGDRRRHDACRASSCATSCPTPSRRCWCRRTYICASAMITEAILSFIGAGTPPNIPSWGNIMAEARSLFQIAGYLIFFPGIFLSLTVLAVNLLGDGMRDALDPRLARQHVSMTHGRAAAPLLEVEDLQDVFLHARRRRARGRRRVVLGRSRARRSPSSANPAAARASRRCRSCG